MIDTISNILVSIIIPVYNSEKYIEETINSCLSQSYANFELILVNDGSTDKSEVVILQFKDSRIKYFKIDNVGACEARNFGILKATGQLYQFLDHDDVLEIDKLYNQINKYCEFGDNYIYSAEMGTISGISKKKDENYQMYEKNFTPIEYYSIVLNQFGKYMTTGVWLIPRMLIHSTYGWDKRTGLNDDGEYFMRIILNSKGIIFCERSLFFFRRDVVNSLSKQFNTKDVYIKWLYSYQSYVQHFLEHFEYTKAKELGWKALSVYYCCSYPKYPDLLKECIDGMKTLGYEVPNAYGGNIFVQISKIIGIKNALKLWHVKYILQNKK